MRFLIRSVAFSFAVVLFARNIGWRHEEAGLGVAIGLAGQRPVGCEMHDAVLRKLAARAQSLNIALGGARAKSDFPHIGVQSLR